MNKYALLMLCVSSTVWADDEVPPAESPPPVVEEPKPAPEVPVGKPVELTTFESAPVPITTWAPWFAPKLYLELEVYTQGRYTKRGGDDLSELRLDRGELGGRMQLGKSAVAELRFEAIRSAVEGGSLGIDGDSTVFRVRTAQVVGSHQLADKLRLEGALGFVPDPWIRALEDGYTAKPLSRLGSERLVFWQAADLAAQLRLTAGPVRATINLGNGEGLQFPERNTGKTTTGLLEVAPIATEDLRIVVAGVVRDGSLGVASIRDRRFGGGGTVMTPRVRGGFEAVFAQGIGDQAAAEGLLTSAWVDANVIDRVFVTARGASLGFSDGGGRQSTFGGGLAYEPWVGTERGLQDPGHQRGRLRLWLAIDRVISSGGAMPIPGADAGNATQVMLIASAIAPFTLE